MKLSLLGRLETSFAIYCVTITLASSASAQLLFEDNFNKSGPPCCDNIDPDVADALGRQSGLYAPLDYVEDVDHENPSGIRNNMTQVNNPDYPNALLLAPSRDVGFEIVVFARPDHDFSERPWPSRPHGD